MNLDPSIYFIIIVPDGQPGRASPMQGFAMSLIQNSWLIRKVAALPATIYDLTDDGRETLLARRISGTSPVNWYAQSPSAIRSIPHPSFIPFSLIMLPDTESPRDYTEWAELSPLRPTIIAKFDGDLSFDDVTIEGLQAHFLKVCDRIPKYIDPGSVESARNALKAWKTMPTRSLGYQVGGHNSVAPNLAALSAAGFSDMIYGPFDKLSSGIKPYVDQIVRTTESILEERDKVGERDLQRIFRPTPDINLFAPAIYPHFFGLPLPISMNREERNRFQNVRRVLKRQTGYLFEVRTTAQQSAILGKSFAESDGKQEPLPHPLMLIRAGELSLATEAMAALAASEFSAVIRLPNEINRTLGSVRSFSEHYRSDQPTSRKRLLAFRQVQARLASAFPVEFLNLIRRSTTGIRIVSDAHLEWLDLDGLPLVIRKTCTRIPVTPGNLLVDDLAAKPLLHLTPEHFRKILVISAFKRVDPIRGIFESAFGAFERHWRDHLTVEIVEVANEDEFVKAFNDFDGPMIVFDGHGSHSRNEPAKIHLQDEAVDVWSLSEKIQRMPPIVILSACDTHAADRNHATTANGFLHLGARTVLSSVFPLDARFAAIFTARFIFRIAAFLGPAIGAFSGGLTWSEVVSGMLRMQLLTDFLRPLLTNQQIDEESYERIHIEGNMAINSRASDPFATVVSRLEDMGFAKTNIKLALEVAVANSSVISYLQIGRPETILIDDRRRMERQMEDHHGAAAVG